MVAGRQHKGCVRWIMVTVMNVFTLAMLSMYVMVSRGQAHIFPCLPNLQMMWSNALREYIVVLYIHTFFVKS